MMSEDMK